MRSPKYKCYDTQRGTSWQKPFFVCLLANIWLFFQFHLINWQNPKRVNHFCKIFFFYLNITFSFAKLPKLSFCKHFFSLYSYIFLHSVKQYSWWSDWFMLWQKLIGPIIVILFHCFVWFFCCFSSPKPSLFWVSKEQEQFGSGFHLFNLETLDFDSHLQ